MRSESLSVVVVLQHSANDPGNENGYDVGHDSVGVHDADSYNNCAVMINVILAVISIVILTMRMILILIMAIMMNL